MSDYTIHRLRIGEYIPSSIQSIVNDPFSSAVAIGRQDGQIEILSDSRSKWVSQAMVSGIIGQEESNFQLRSLVWSQCKESKNRLFGISLRGFLFEACI